MIFMGIDGGGSTIRVIITHENLEMIGQAHGRVVNPTTIGRDLSSQLIRQKMREAITNGNLTPDQITGVGIGIAGASSEYAFDWLNEVVRDVTPTALIVPSSDNEIALVGAHGKREGVMVLSGTGSVAYGVNAAGEGWRVGGWGYMIGDEGSGYGLGSRAIRACVRADDNRGPQTSLTPVILQALGMSDFTNMNVWMYNTSQPRVPDVAKLAPLVLEQAAAGDAVAQEIVEWGADELALHVHAIVTKLKIENPEIAFAGGLLTRPNPLSHALCQRLGLSEIPMPKYEPVKGAALLAILKYKEHHAH